MTYNSLSFAFFGTDEFSIIVLEELVQAGFIPSVIVTVPDQPKGRGLVITPPPIKLWATKHDIPFIQPISLSDHSINFQLSSAKADNFQLFIVASYGLIIPENILDIPVKGTLNVHPSLLPKYRGATPIESQILNGAKEVGVTVMLMDAKMDHGLIVAQKKIISEGMVSATILQKKLGEEGGRLLGGVLPQWVSGKLEARAQDHAEATYTKKLTKANGEINFSDDPYKNFLKIQAFEGSIGTYFYVESKRNGKRERTRKTRVNIKAAEFKGGKCIITRVVPEGKKEMNYSDFLLGFNI